MLFIAAVSGLVLLTTQSFFFVTSQCGASMATSAKSIGKARARLGKAKAKAKPKMGKAKGKAKPTASD